MPVPRKTLWRAGEIAPAMRPFRQKLNPNSLFRAAGLSRLAGMSRAHVSLVRLPPGKDSFAYHAHMLEEEWIYILSGRAIADIDGDSAEVGPGDFMGFATPSPPHLLRNTFDEECTYLMGGEDRPIDVVSYPELEKRFLMMQTEKGAEFYELGEPTKPFGDPD
jgi:uncharacterized cupin superfamily protein